MDTTRHSVEAPTIPTLEPEEQRKTIRKVLLRLVPILALGYFFNALEKTNIGLAGLHMNAALGLTASMFGLAAGLLFVGYALFEVPSNVMMMKFGARRWLARIMITWGLCAAATGFVTNEWGLYAVRFLLGVAEAGFYPGVIMYFALWVPREYRGTMFSLFVLGGTSAAILGAPLTGFLLTPDSYFGIDSWRVMFVLEGIPAVLVGIACLFVLADRPGTAKWLSVRERTWLEGTIAQQEANIPHNRGASGALKSLKDLRVIVLSFIYFCLKCGQYSIIFFLPLIIAGFKTTSELSTLQIGLITGLPALCAIVPSILWARHSDKTQERRWHATIPALIGGIGIGASALVDSPIMIMVFICFAMVGLVSQSASFYQIPGLFLTGAAAATAIALINSLGNLGGFVAPTIFGVLKDATGGYQIPSLVMAGVLLVGATTTALLPVMFKSLARPKVSERSTPEGS
ncbi:MFS transporter [Rhodococcus sp. IEGM 1330]|uniref:MFS transporter n=1 Tax=Rhodococcus sp. IEGM 1330 TaxID=3082225 RepID=UPI00295321D3|nr:MFS transporter [Rhodococcus sp. IEGM 1330]MDV8025322.1 MFS transporter [Rhodococcus sp. IEGM 1330]